MTSISQYHRHRCTVMVLQTRQRGQVIVLRTKCGESLLFLYPLDALADEARLHSLSVPKIFLLFCFPPIAGMMYCSSRQSCPLSSTISGHQMVYDVMNLLYPSNTHHLPVARSCVSTVASERGSSGPIDYRRLIKLMY